MERGLHHETWTQSHSVLLQIRAARPVGSPRRYPRPRDGILRRIATLIPFANPAVKCTHPRSTKGRLPVTASWRSGVRRPRRVSHHEAAGDVRCRSRPHPSERTTVRTTRGASTRSAHRHYERSPRDGLRAGRRAGGESRKPGEDRYGQSAPCLTPPPRTGSAEVEVEKRRGGRRRRCQSKRKRERCLPGARHPLRSGERT